MSTRARLALDVAMFAAVLVAYNPAWTGSALHEWLCLAIMAALFVHLVVNWDQTTRMLARFVGRLRAMPRLNLVVDIALFVAFVTVMLSGLVISQAITGALGITNTPSALWIHVHSAAADVAVALLLAHAVLHWKWIVRTVRRWLAPETAAAKADPVPNEGGS